MQNPIKTNQQPTTLPTTIGAGDLTLCKGACYQADNLGSIPEVHVVEGGDMSSDLHICTTHSPKQMHAK